MTLLYITYIDFGELGSGSSVRPQRMYEAFRALGVEVKLVSGLQNRRKERKHIVEDVRRWLQTHRPDACYIEPPSCPIYGKADRDLIRLVRKMGIPTAVFYRDAHWLYADWWGVTGVKALVLRRWHRRDLRLFQKTCDKVYFPSETMQTLFADTPFAATGVLPPGCETVQPAHTQFYRRMIYVGGVREAYGTDLLLAAFRQLYEEGYPVELVLCCRAEEMDNLPAGSFDQPFLRVVHAQGDALKPLYEQCDAGLLPLRRDRYMDLALPVKLFEYLGNGLPVITTDCPESARFVAAHHAGQVCRASAEALARAVADFYQNESLAAATAQNACSTARRNRWVDRARQVLKDVTPVENASRPAEEVDAV